MVAGSSPMAREQRAALVEVEAEIDLPDLAEVALHPQTMQSHHRVTAAAEHQAEVAKPSVQHVLQLPSGVQRHLVEVVDDDPDPSRQHPVVDQDRFQRVAGRVPVERDEGDRGITEVRFDLLHGSDEAPPEPGRVFVTSISVEPRVRLVGALRVPLPEQRRLAGSGRADDDGQWQRIGPAQPVDQCTPLDERCPNGRREELRVGEERPPSARRRHRSTPRSMTEHAHRTAPPEPNESDPTSLSGHPGLGIHLPGVMFGIIRCEHTQRMSRVDERIR